MSTAGGEEKGAKGEEGRRLLRVFLKPRAFFMIPPLAVEFFFEKTAFYANQTIYDSRGRQRRGFAGDECFFAVT